jgi:hypothetical protein
VSKSRVLLPVLVTLAIAPTAQAAPNDACVRQAQGVPGAANHTPEWWNTTLSESQREVRWTGAAVRTDDQSSTPELSRTRMIWDSPSQTMFFEFEVNGDPSINTSQDMAVLTLGNTAGTAPDLFIRVQPLRGCSTVANCTGAGSAISNSAISYSQATVLPSSIAWSALSNVNPNPAFTVSHPWVRVREIVSGGTTTYNWTLSFALQVPVDGSGNVRPNLRLYGNAIMYMPGPSAGIAVEFPLLCNPGSGSGSECLMFSGASSGTIMEDVPVTNMGTLWPVLDTANPSSCDGVEVMRDLVGSSYNTYNATVPGTAVPYELPGFQIPHATGARFRAGFHNDTTQTVPAGSIKAEFRIANWGLQWTDWHNATWNLVATAELNAPVTAGGYAGAFGQGRVESEVWVPATSGLTLENTHQCVHVRLKSDTGVDFKVDSVYRNMDIVNASVARRPAIIDLGDRPAPAGKDNHDVYLLVRSEHMPDPGACDASKDRLYGCSKGGKLILERRALSKKQKAALSKDFKAGRIKLDEAQFDDLMKQKARKGKKAEELPYVVVHGMVDTGRRINLPDAPDTPVLVNFSDYGYYVQHEGEPVEGWETYIHGAEPVKGLEKSVFKLEVEPKKVASVANTVRVLSKETKACKKPPQAKWAVYDEKKAEEIEAKLTAELGKGNAADVGKVRVTDEQLGCDPPPLRAQCRLKNCGELSPAAYIEGSRFVGDWTVLERRKLRQAGRKPGAKRPGAKVRPGAKPGAKPAKPGAKPAGKAVPAGKRAPAAGK